jgi:acyl carrier protein
MNDTQASTLAENGLREVLGDQAGAISWDSPAERTLRNIGLTSLTLYELVSVLEELGGLSFRDEDIDSANFVTLASLRDLLARYPLGRAPRTEPPSEDAGPCS